MFVRKTYHIHLFSSLSTFTYIQTFHFRNSLYIIHDLTLLGCWKAKEFQEYEFHYLIFQDNVKVWSINCLSTQCCYLWQVHYVHLYFFLDRTKMAEDLAYCEDTIFIKFCNYVIVFIGDYLFELIYLYIIKSCNGIWNIFNVLYF